MNRSRMIAVLAPIHRVFAILLNSVGMVIVQAMISVGMAKPQASLIELFKELDDRSALLLTTSFCPDWAITTK